MWNREWYFCRGDVKVTVMAETEEGEVVFDFHAYVSEGIGDYDMLEGLDEVATAMAHLRAAYRSNIIAVEVKK